LRRTESGREWVECEPQRLERERLERESQAERSRINQEYLNSRLGLGLGQPGGNRDLR